jgi:hypothetical protein
MTPLQGRLEARQLGGHTVVPGQQQRRLVVAGQLVVRVAETFVSTLVIVTVFSAWRLLLVEHMAGDRSSRFLREQMRRRRIPG